MAIPPISLAAIAAGTGGYVLRGAITGFETGLSAAAIGDFNQDGFIDVILGAPKAFQAPNEAAAGGLAYVVYGAATAPASPVALTAIAAGTGGFVVIGEFFANPTPQDNAGFAVAGGGDINGDGLADFVITAPNGDGALDADIDAGTIYVVFGQPGGLSTVFLSDILGGIGGFAIHGAGEVDRAGTAVSFGDVNSDGLDDLLIGASGVAGNNGAGYVVFGKTTPFAAELSLSDIAAGTGGFALTGEGAQDRAGSATAILDLNNDGINDIAIGAHTADGTDNLHAQAGDIYVRYGSTDPQSTATLPGAGGVAIRGHSNGLGAGTTLAAAGDLNGDGITDLAIGAPSATPLYGNGNDGIVYVVFGSGSLAPVIELSDILAGTGGFAITGDEEFDAAGAAIAGAGDVNGDGLDDLLVGAPGLLGATVGKTYVIFGRAEGFGATVALADIAAGAGGFVITGEAGNDTSGSAVAAGDLNGDGYADLLIGARRGDGNNDEQFDAGDAYIVYGGDFSVAVTHEGDGDANVLDGTIDADNIIGGRGNDTINTNGGADAVHGGQGDDLIRVVGLNIRRVDGGTGTDTLALTASGQTLDLADYVGSVLTDIERIDINGAGANTIRVGIPQVQGLSSTGNALRVIAGADDTVDLLGNPWVQGATAGGFTTYTAPNATLDSSEAATVLPCFATGSHIATARGEVRVEDLREGDIAVLADGRRRAVRWIGHREVRIARHPRPWDVQPIRIRADAFGPGRPYRDLRLSPDHAVFAHGALVPVRHLVNGATIVQEHVGDITYWHVELAADDGSAAHDVLLAEGLPVESFLDTGNRSAFANGGGATMLHPDFALRTWEASACAPLLRDGPALSDLRTELLAEATALGWEVTPDPDLRLLVDGRPVWPQLEEGRYVVRLSAGARVARLRSRSTTPAWLRCDTDDRRRLGVAVTHLALDGTAIALDDPRLSGGWHPAEGDWRWTDGDAALPVAGARLLTLAVAPLEQYWHKPRRAARELAHMQAGTRP